MFPTINRQIRKRRKAFSLYQDKLGLVGTLQYLVRRAITPRGRLIPIKILNGGQLYLRNGFYDTVIFSQIFIYEDLKFDLPNAPLAIVDCGANIGLSTLYFKFKYPNTKIISIEPESSNFEMLKKNTSALKDIHLLKNGVWNKTCKLYLVDTGEGHASFRVSETDPKTNVIAVIDAVSINDVFERFALKKVDLLKMDIEGSEYDCFTDQKLSWVDKTTCIAIEIHEHMHPGCKAVIDDALNQRSYKLNGEYHIYSKMED